MLSDPDLQMGKLGDKDPLPRLTLVIYKMSGGGAQRVLSILANYFTEKGWSITLMTFDDGSEPSFYELHTSINCRTLSVMRNQGGLLKAVWMHLLRPFILRRAIIKSKPDAVIAFIDLTNILTLVATLGLRIPVIISERVNPAYHSIGCFWSTLRLLIYRRVSCLVVQTQDALLWFSPSIQKLSRIIPNPIIPVSKAEEKEKEEPPQKIIMAMGRLCEQKGFDLLLKAFSRIETQFPEWKLHIWGQGAEKENLKRIRDELGLKERVCFKGMIHDHYKTMQQADIFVLSSRYEGFPNVLGEAMACGIPVVSFNCPSGPGELIIHEKNGLLVPNINDEELAKEIHRLMENELLAKQLGDEAQKITETFSLEKVMGLWEKLILEIIGNGRKNL
jgi:GalNAc-alpha-(1->4)-GalNAc-alpha-(1->3)-diNAcBac-PP-undecaprenol alpha-1,4-N-acetyl-D-galactosaminyltransferase